MPEVKSEPIETWTADGFRLRGERWAQGGLPVVVLGHAMMVDRRIMDRPRGEGLASALHRAGLEVMSFDVRGHGESRPRVEEGALFRYDEIVRFDVPAMVGAAREVAARRPVALVGHSLIGHAGLIAAGRAPEAAPDAIVALAPNLWAPHLEPSRIARGAKRASLALFEALTRAGGHFDARALRFGTNGEPLPYVAQFRRMWREDRLGSFDGEDYEAALARVSCPVLALASAGDRLLARPAAVARFLAPIDDRWLHYEVLDGAGAPDHMGLVTGRASHALGTRIAAWVSETLA